MYRNNLIAWALSVCLIALMPTAGTAQTDKVKASMAAVKAETAKLGAPKVEGVTFISARQRFPTISSIRCTRSMAARPRCS